MIREGDEQNGTGLDARVPFSRGRLQLREPCGGNARLSGTRQNDMQIGIPNANLEARDNFDQEGPVGHRRRADPRLGLADPRPGLLSIHGSNSGGRMRTMASGDMW